MRFSADEEKFLAEYYADNYKILSGSTNTPEINAKREGHYRKLTESLNALSVGRNFTVKQIRKKIQNLKQGAKKKNVHNNKEIRPTGGGEVDMEDLTPAEEVIVAALGNTPGFKGLAVSVDSARRRPPQKEPEGETGEDGQFETIAITDAGGNTVFNAYASFTSGNDHHQQEDRGQFTETNLSRSQLDLRRENTDAAESPDLVRPTNESTVSATSGTMRSHRQLCRKRSMNEPISRFDDDSDDSSRTTTAASKSRRKLSKRTVGQSAIETGDLLATQQKVLRLQIKSCEGSMRMNAKMEKMLEKVSTVVEEFREAVAEFRMHIRGLDVNNIPITLPEAVAAAVQQQ